ncbi:UNKNOWN [Stylonychia lemnae]|uniref:Uncharacterized protein n=1 Tax=Stylonychia lemnae TaxID=5949 RepID=A0A078AYQ4_STYLE|nr:UNKNOWN [Stylonychia lemnae]|eukprot:CDW87266.1 UNKNOWN [Stylonychia lemnae]
MNQQIRTSLQQKSMHNQIKININNGCQAAGASTINQGGYDQNASFSNVVDRLTTKKSRTVIQSAEQGTAKEKFNKWTTQVIKDESEYEDTLHAIQYRLAKSKHSDFYIKLNILQERIQVYKYLFLDRTPKYLQKKQVQQEEKIQEELKPQVRRNSRRRQSMRWLSKELKTTDQQLDMNKIIKPMNGQSNHNYHNLNFTQNSSTNAASGLKIPLKLTQDPNSMISTGSSMAGRRLTRAHVNQNDIQNLNLQYPKHEAKVNKVRSTSSLLTNLKQRANYNSQVFYTEVQDLNSPGSAIPFDNDSNPQNSRGQKGKMEKIQSKDENMIVQLVTDINTLSNEKQKQIGKKLSMPSLDLQRMSYNQTYDDFSMRRYVNPQYDKVQSKISNYISSYQDSELYKKIKEQREDRRKFIEKLREAKEIQELEEKRMIKTERGVCIPIKVQFDYSKTKSLYDQSMQSLKDTTKYAQTVRKKMFSKRLSSL